MLSFIEDISRARRTVLFLLNQLLQLEYGRDILISVGPVTRPVFPWLQLIKYRLPIATHMRLYRGALADFSGCLVDFFHHSSLRGGTERLFSEMIRESSPSSRPSR